MQRQRHRQGAVPREGADFEHLPSGNQTNEQGKKVALLGRCLHARVRQDIRTRAQGSQLIMLWWLVSEEIGVQPVIDSRVFAHARSVPPNFVWHTAVVSGPSMLRPRCIRSP